MNEYSIARPRTRAECRDEARPCPWVSCRHHLAIDIAEASPRPLGRPSERNGRPTALRLLARTSSGGRRRGLRASAAQHVFEAWLADAVESLALMEFTCALDVVDAYPDGIGHRHLAKILRISKARAENEIRDARAKVAAAATEARELLELADAAPHPTPSGWLTDRSPVQAQRHANGASRGRTRGRQ